jgi:hypothetical protein
MVNTILLDSGMEKARDIFSWDTTYVHGITIPRNTMSIE